MMEIFWVQYTKNIRSSQVSSKSRRDNEDLILYKSVLESVVKKPVERIEDREWSSLDAKKIN